MKLTAFLITLISMTNLLSAQTYKTVKDAHGIPIGANAPLFSAISADSTTFTLAEALKKGPVVVIFYRGFWCPFCNKHLAQVQDSLNLILEKGASVIAVSPEKPEYLDKMVKKSGAQFTLLYDDNYTISDAFDVTFKPDTAQALMYNVGLRANLKKSHSDDSERLPIPATYVLDQKGVVIWRQFDPNYKKRSTIQDIVNALKLAK